MTAPTKGSHSKSQNDTDSKHPNDAPGESAENARLSLLEPPSTAKAKRGRKPGTHQRSAKDRLEEKLAAIERLREEARILERETHQRTAGIVGRALLDLADADPLFRQAMVDRLRAVKLSAQDRAEIAHLFIDQAGAKP